ncbi:MAG: GGDEF domain-containing protein [Sulfurimonas sp.]|jgi:diguanylate cyclase (GGDEF)-like protein
MNQYKILNVDTSSLTSGMIGIICNDLDMKHIHTTGKMSTLEYLMDNQADVIVVHTDIGELEIIELLDIINQDYENTQTPIIIISTLENIQSLASSVSSFNVISIFTHDYWQFQLSNLLKYFKSQTLHTTTLKRELNQSELRNIQDPLTGALNRFGAQDTFTHLTSRFKAYKEQFSIVMLDIDHFKKVNDMHGHSIGDEVLISVASLLQKSIRNNDALIRCGGEEFLIFISKNNTQTSKDIAEKLRLKIEDSIHSSIDLKVTASFGVVDYKENEDLDSLLKRADTLLYTAKHSGRNRVITSQ